LNLPDHEYDPSSWRQTTTPLSSEEKTTITGFSSQVAVALQARSSKPVYVRGAESESHLPPDRTLPRQCQIGFGFQLESGPQK
jgi:hypothetical protein